MFFMPTLNSFTILLILALGPAIALMVLIYRQDAIEKESKPLLAKLFFFGCLSCFPAALFEVVFGSWAAADLPSDTVLFAFIFAFFIVAFAEEGSKFVFLNTMRHDPRFNYTFDGVIYAVMVGLGFAVLENLEYVFLSPDGGLSTALARALTAIPGHCSYAVIMGAFYGLAKKFEMYGDIGKATWYRWLSFLVPMSVHGFYDAALMSSDAFLGAVAFIVDFTAIIIAALLVKRTAGHDSPVAPAPPAGNGGQEAARTAAAPWAAGFHGGMNR